MTMTITTIFTHFSTLSSVNLDVRHVQWSLKLFEESTINLNTYPGPGYEVFLPEDVVAFSNVFKFDSSLSLWKNDSEASLL